MSAADAPRFWLRARIARSGGVEVCLPLDGGAAVFVEADETPPPGRSLRLARDHDGDPRLVLGDSGGDARSLTELFALLLPGQYPRWRTRLRNVLELDNRLDLEEALSSLRDTLGAVARWWLTVDEQFRCARESELAAFDPELVSSIHQAAARGGEVWNPAEAHSGSMNGSAEPRADGRDWASLDPAGVLGPDGRLAETLGERFEARQGQLDMAERVARVLDRQEHLMVEAGTGIGKSLAYLVPLVLHLQRVDERAVVSTYTRNLQAQLFEQDLPLLRRLGWRGEARLLLGRNNYLCRRQLRRALHAPVEDADTARARFALALWSQQSLEGRREELADHPWFEKHWRVFFESVEPCSPHICHRDPVCFVVRARRAAREASLVVVNHSLLMMDLKSAQSLVGPARLLVVDEAHHLPDVATRGLSHTISLERLEVYANLLGERGRHRRREVLENLANAVGGSDGLVEACDRADRASEAFLGAFRRWFGALESEVRTRLGDGAPRPGSHRIHDGDEAFGGIREFSAAVHDAAGALQRQLAAVLAASGEIEEHGAALGEEREALASLLEFHREFAAQIDFCLRADDEDWVYWLEWGGDRGLRALIAAPLTVEQPLARLWDDHYRSVILTSATLTVERDFEPFAESVGFTRTARFTDSLSIPSPFRAQEQSLVLSALELPTLEDPRFPAEVASTVAHIARSVRTKILVLSTSYRLLDALEEELRPRLEAGEDDLFELPAGVRSQLLIQRPGTARSSLAERFRRAEAAVLLATGSFWEGVDFPGDQLEVLVVPRLPFAVPTDPIVEGRSDRARRLGRDPFETVALVDAILRLKQGVGRLLRTSEDRGAVLLLDHRLQSKPYGARFLNSLPRACELVADLDEAARRTVDFLRA